MSNKIFLCMDLKSFFASVECVLRKLDPLKTNLVVADVSRTDKGICLAVTPSLKSLGVSGRPRLYEVNQVIDKLNRKRNINIKNPKSSFNITEIHNDPGIKIDFIIAKPQMKYYIEYSSKIYEIYLKYISSDDIYSYSIDEVFIDLTTYLKVYNISAYELASKIMHDVLKTYNITVTGGIGTNPYLAKVAMDINAKKIDADQYGNRIAYLDENLYKETLWDHQPITDFWRIGNGYKERLYKLGLYTMGDIAAFSLKDEDVLFKEFGINAELLIDHAWGYEPVTLKDIKSYIPTFNSLSNGQVLHSAYTYEKTKIIVREMGEALAYNLFNKKLVTKQLGLRIDYDVLNLKDEKISDNYYGKVVIDSYGRKVPKYVNCTINLKRYTALDNEIADALIVAFKKISNPILLVRKVSVSANKLEIKDKITAHEQIQLSLFDNLNNDDLNKQEVLRDENYSIMDAVSKIKSKYGKNSIIKVANLVDGATAIERNKQIGGHKE